MKRTIDYIESIVCAVRGNTPEQLRERWGNGKLSRKGQVKETRQIVMALALESGHSQWATGKHYNMTHCSALYSRSHINDLVGYEKDLRDEIDIIKSILEDEALYREFLRMRIKARLKAIAERVNFEEEFERMAV